MWCHATLPSGSRHHDCDREEVPKNWAILCDSVTDNFRVINPADFRVLKA
jgi:hypothetical protein